MSDDYDGDDYVDYDDDWLYIEDDYGLADELAESQIPDPGWAGTGFHIDVESFEFDLYDYWNDLEYADDAYWEDLGSNIRPDMVRKRMREEDAHISAKSRRKAAPANRAWEPIVFRSREERARLAEQNTPPLPDSAPYTFFVNWKRHFRDEPYQHLAKSMPAEMRNAAKSEISGDDALENPEDWEDDDEDVEQVAISNLDLEALRPVLQEILQTKLGPAGLQDIDMDAFMESIGSMMSGGGRADDAIGELANSLLGKLGDEDGGNALSDWLSGQGVALDAEDDETPSNATAEPLMDSPRDGSAHMQPTGQKSARKRPRADTEGDMMLDGQRKKVNLDPPPSALPQEQSRIDHGHAPRAGGDLLDVDCVSGLQDTDQMGDIGADTINIANKRKRHLDETPRTSQSKRLKQPR